MAASDPIRLAIVGAGLFARDSHLPAIQSLGTAYEIVAVASRSQQSASRLAEHISPHVEATTDVDALLTRPDIDAVDIVMPIDSMPAMVEKALRAGKHVISEKPVAPDVATGHRLLSVPRNSVWMVAENWRYASAFHRVAELLKSGRIGAPRVFHWALSIVMNEANKYYSTPWRREGSFPGGFLLDGGVHHTALMRLMFGEVKSLKAFTAQLREDLPPTDTLAAALEFDSGVLGTYSVSFAVPQSMDTGLVIVGEDGILRVTRTRLEITQGGETQTESFNDDSLKQEFAAFARAVRAGESHLNTPEQAVQDVAIIEAILRSGESGGRIEPERIV